MLSKVFNSYNNEKIKLENVKIIIDVANKGIDLLNKEIDYTLLNAYQNYIISILNIVSNNMKTNYEEQYCRFNLYINYLTPYEQLKRNIEFLINLGKNI